MTDENDGNIFEELADVAHENAYYCAINDGYDILKELGATSEMKLSFVDKMKHMAQVRAATKFILTKE